MSGKKIESIEEKVEKYRKLTKKALEKIEVFESNSIEQNKTAEILLDMAKNYFSDAQYFEKKKEFFTALAAYSYAHAWIDAGVRLKVLNGKGDDKLFVLP